MSSKLLVMLLLLTTASCSRDAPDLRPPSSTVSASSATPKRSVIRTASLTLTSKRPHDVQLGAARIAEKYGGFVASSEANAQSGALQSVSMSLRVPSARLQAALDEISALGTLEQQTVGAEDVTRKVFDTESRLKNKRVLAERLREIATRSGSMADVLALEREINRVEGELDDLDGQRQTLADQTELATVQVIARVPDPASDEELSFWHRMTRAATRGVRGFSAAAEMLVVAVISLSPVIFIGAATWFLARAVARRKRREPLI